MTVLTLVWAAIFAATVLLVLAIFITRPDAVSKIIAALNGLTTPWVAITVILMGMVYGVIAHTHGLSGDGASGVIGAGIGLLTGQALSKSQQTQEPMPTPPPPVTPKEP